MIESEKVQKIVDIVDFLHRCEKKGNVDMETLIALERWELKQILKS